jgi:hypothetical protein
MAYILGTLNRLIREEPENKDAERRASALVRGMRRLVVQRKVSTFWSGDFHADEPIYEFPNDVYLEDGGFDLTRHTGRGEQSIRNGMMLHSLAVRADRDGDEVALDLACGMANHLLGVSRYFNYRMEFFGHVHSAVWVASGLARLGRIARARRYAEKAKAIFDYVRSLSSSFGWVPEYAQWHPMVEEHCETCCIKDMIQCALELVDAGYDECWDVANSFVRNQLVENQIKNGSFVAVDNSLPDTVDTIYRDIDKRVVGGFSGGTEVNSISLKAFRSIAGCCVGTAPQALELVWDRVVTGRRGKVSVNLPIDKDDPRATVESGYPNKGYMRVTPKRAGEVRIRIYPWMGKGVRIKLDGKTVRPKRRGSYVVLGGVKAGQVVELRHPLRTVTRSEVVKGKEFKVLWRGPDVVDILPHGEPLRLYQRKLGVRKYYPRAPKVGTKDGGFEAKPTQQAD